MEILKQRNQKQLVVWSSIVIVSVIALFGLWKMTTKDNNPIQFTFTNSDHIFGQNESKVTIVEYSDFQCPACRYYYNLIQPIKEKYKDKITFVYRNFPLTNSHKFAQVAAQAAESAGRQNKFYEMHDKLFDNQNIWSVTTDPKPEFKKYAQELKLDVEKWEKDFDSTEVKSKIAADVQSARDIGVNQTPTFYLNGVQMAGFSSSGDFEKSIQAALSK